MFLNKSLYWYYSEGHHGNFPMDDEGETIKNLIFRKVKSGQIVVHTPKEFSTNLFHISMTEEIAV